MRLSPYKLIQEFLCHDPWKMLVACIMLNQTSITQVKKVVWKFFEKWPTAIDASNASEEEMTELVRPLGLYNRRTRSIQRLSRKFRDGFDCAIGDLPGVGKYAADSYKIFIEKKLIEDADDKELKKYLSWAKAECCQRNQIF